MLSNCMKLDAQILTSTSFSPDLSQYLLFILFWQPLNNLIQKVKIQRNTLWCAIFHILKKIICKGMWSEKESYKYNKR